MWKHEHNPFGASPILVAEADGRIVGVRVFMRWNWSMGPERVTAVRAVDTATHPDWRARGIFSRLTLALVERMRTEHIEFVFNTPNELSRPGYLKMGWSSVGRVSLWVRPRRIRRMTRALMKRGRHGEDRYDREVEHLTNGHVQLFPSAEFVGLAGLDDFLEELPRDDTRLTTRVTSEYLRWRYAEIPAFEYWAAWSRKSEHGAAIVCRIRSYRGLRELRLCEVLVGRTPRSIRFAAELIGDVVRGADPDYAAAIAASGTPERRALLSAGFIPAPRVGPVLTVRPLSQDKREFDPLLRSAWRLSIGNLELF